MRPNNFIADILFYVPYTMELEIGKRSPEPQIRYLN